MRQLGLMLFSGLLVSLGIRRADAQDCASGQVCSNGVCSSASCVGCGRTCCCQGLVCSNAACASSCAGGFTACNTICRHELRCEQLRSLWLLVRFRFDLQQRSVFSAPLVL